MTYWHLKHDGSQNNHAEWKRLAWKKYLLHDFIYTKLVYKTQSIVTETRSVVAWVLRVDGWDYKQAGGNLSGWWICSLSWLWRCFHRYVYKSKFIVVHILNACSLLSVNYSPIKLKMQKEYILMHQSRNALWCPTSSWTDHCDSHFPFLCLIGILTEQIT